MTRSFGIAFLLLALTAARAPAQLAVEPGDRVHVRLSLDAANRFAVEPQLVGEVLSVTADTLTLQIHGDVSPLAIPILALERVDRSLGVPPRLQNALTWGALTAAASAVWIPLSEEQDDPSYRTVEENAIIGAALGAVVGGVVGLLVREERWEHLRLPHDPAAPVREVHFPRVIAGVGWGPTGRGGESGDEHHARVGVGLARIADELQLRAELMYQESSIDRYPTACTLAREGYCLEQGEETRRVGGGLTLVGHIARIGDHVQLYAPFGLGMVRSRVVSEEIQGCFADGRYVSCEEGPPLETLRASRTAVGLGANLGIGMSVNFRGLEAFVEVREQVIDESANEPAHFVPLSIGLSF